MSSHAEQAGPLAGMFTEETGEAVEEHEIFANFTLACYSHRRGDSCKIRLSENLVRAMVTATSDHTRGHPNLTSQGQH